MKSECKKTDCEKIEKDYNETYGHALNKAELLMRDIRRSAESLIRLEHILRDEIISLTEKQETKSAGESFGTRLKRLREEAGMNQGETAELIGISRVSLSHYERGQRLPDIEVLKSFCVLFGVTSDYLIGKSELRKRRNIE